MSNNLLLRFQGQVEKSQLALWSGHWRRHESGAFVRSRSIGRAHLKRETREEICGAKVWLFLIDVRVSALQSGYEESIRLAQWTRSTSALVAVAMLGKPTADVVKSSLFRSDQNVYSVLEGTAFPQNGPSVWAVGQ